MQTCPDCHALVEDQLKYCDNCGFRLLPEEMESPSSVEGLPALSAEEKKHFERTGEGDQSVPHGACSACGYINLPGETFCNNCGVQLAPVISIPPPPPVLVPTPSEDIGEAAPSEKPTPGVCTYCGYSNDPGETFCMNCGLQLSTAGVVSASLPPQKAPVEIPASPPVEIPASPSAVTSPQSAPELQVESAPVSDLGVVWGKLIVGDTGAEILLPTGKSELLIGRSDPVRNIFPDVDLTPHGGELNGVSRMHAKLEIQGADKMIEDLNSTNFTFLNRQKLEPGQRYPIHNGDEIRLGLLRLEYLAK